MNQMRKVSLACVFVWTFLGVVVLSNGRPSDVNDSESTVPPMSDPSTVTDDKTVGNAASVVVPQVGYLEERSDVSDIGKDPLPVVVTSPNASGSGVGQPPGNSANGLLVPIVSVVDGDSSKSSNGIVNHPLVALLPAPNVDGQDSNLPEISPLSIVQAEPAKPEVTNGEEVANPPMTPMTN